MTSERSKNLWPNVLSVVALVAGFVVAVGLMVAAFAVSFCSLFGDQCTPAEEQTMSLLSLASFGVYLLVPVAVAAARRQARWLLAPVIEAVLVVGIFVAVDVF